MQIMIHKTRAWIVSYCLLVMFATNTQAGEKLDQLEEAIQLTTNIEQVTVDLVHQQMLGKEQAPALFDVRTEEEFQTSHLEGAIRLDPDSDPHDFVKEYGALLGQRPVVFYCSVGRRSTKMAENVSALINTKDRPVNMKGGIFHWHNEQLPLINEQGPTKFVHPFNWYWKRLLDHPNLSAFAPQAQR